MSDSWKTVAPHTMRAINMVWAFPLFLFIVLIVSWAMRSESLQVSFSAFVGGACVVQVILGVLSAMYASKEQANLHAIGI